MVLPTDDLDLGKNKFTSTAGEQMYIFQVFKPSFLEREHFQIFRNQDFGIFGAHPP